MKVNIPALRRTNWPDSESKAMPFCSLSYAYPIQINREALRIHHEEVREIPQDYLTLADLQFVGADSFVVQERDSPGGWIVRVSRSRLETFQERDTRVAGEVAYMAEYYRRRNRN
jgi:hypothetical protein